MTYYNVTATVSAIGWVTVEAATPDEALEVAREYAARDYELDMGTAEVEFNVEPTVEVV